MLSILKNTIDPNSNDAQNPLTKKWLAIEKKQKRNANFQQKSADLYKNFQEIILPEEQKNIALLAQETEHLIQFLPRKSFTKWQREELQSWIEHNLDELVAHPFADQEIFRSTAQKYSDYLVKDAQNQNKGVDFSAEEIEYMRDMADDMFFGEKEFTEEELISFLRDPEIFQQKLHDFMEENASMEDEYSANDKHEQQETHNEQYDEQEEQTHSQKTHAKNEQLKNLFNSSKLNKLYKILANRLHPDKESEPLLKAQKSELMATLVKAKKNKDAFTIISLFHQFVPENEMSIFAGSDEELSQALMSLLNEKLMKLDDEHHFNKYQNGLQSAVWQKFGGRSKKAIAKNIQEHIEQLANEQAQYNYHINEITTVKSLKEILSQRYDENRFAPFALEGITLDELFDF